MIRESLKQYIEREVIPRYAAFDKAHREDHARMVIDRALTMGKAYDINEELLYTAAACHDLGLAIDRKTHHLESGKAIRQDARLAEWFTREQIETIAQAAEDHRASATTPPRSLYGALVAEADRMIDPVTIGGERWNTSTRNTPKAATSTCSFRAPPTRNPSPSSVPSSATRPA